MCGKRDIVILLAHRKQSLLGRDVNKEWIALRCLPVNFLDELTITEIGSARRRRRRPLTRWAPRTNNMKHCFSKEFFLIIIVDIYLPVT